MDTTTASSGSDWTEDSDPDSPPSPPRPGQNNGFTSDSDSDSTISTSTGSASSDNEEAPAKSTKSNGSHKRPQKRPLIQEISNGGKRGESEESSDEERKRLRN